MTQSTGKRESRNTELQVPGTSRGVCETSQKRRVAGVSGDGRGPTTGNNDEAGTGENGQPGTTRLYRNQMKTQILDVVMRTLVRESEQVVLNYSIDVIETSQRAVKNNVECRWQDASEVGGSRRIMRATTGFRRRQCESRKCRALKDTRSMRLSLVNTASLVCNAAVQKGNT